MSAPTTKYFEVSGSTTLSAATDFTTDSMCVPYGFNWSITAEDFAIIGSPTFTIRVSNTEDGIYRVYNADKAVDIDITDSPYDFVLPFNYMKIEFTSNGATGDFKLLFNGKGR